MVGKQLNINDRDNKAIKHESTWKKTNYETLYHKKLI